MKYCRSGCFFFACIILFTGFLLVSCNARKQTAESIRKSEMLFDTVVTIELYDDSDEALIDACFALGRSYEQMLSRAIESSEIYTLNHAGGQPVTVSDETIQLLERGIFYGELTDGAFDISIAAVTDLWNFSQETPALPSADSIRAAAETVNYQKIQIDGNIVILADPAMQIDLGGIAKGYIADQMKALLAESGVTSAVLNLGGDVITLGGKPDGSKWNIGIQKPFDDQNEVIASVSVRDMAVVSSGSYERYFEHNGELWHHILDPADGWPVRNSLTSVTVIAESGMDADALGTACFALGLTDGMELINTLEDIEAVFITGDGTLHYSDGIGSNIAVTEQ